MSNKKVKAPIAAPISMTLEQEVIFERQQLQKMESIGGRAKGIASEFKSDASMKYYYAFIALIVILLAIHFAG